MKNLTTYFSIEQVLTISGTLGEPRVDSAFIVFLLNLTSSLAKMYNLEPS